MSENDVLFDKALATIMAKERVVLAAQHLVHASDTWGDVDAFTKLVLAVDDLAGVTERNEQ